MWNAPTIKQLAKIPVLYSTETIPASDKKVHMHFFIAGSDWYIAEYDGEDIMFGFAILNGDTDNAEWGYISFKELQDIKIRFLEVDRDKYWKATQVKNIPSIKNLIRN